MKFLTGLFLLIAGAPLILSGLAYVLFFHGQITRPKVEKLLGIGIAAKDNSLPIQKVGDNLFLIGERGDATSVQFFFFSSNDRFELAVESAKTLSLFLDSPVFLCNHYGYPTRTGFGFIPRSSFSRLRGGAIDCFDAGMDFVKRLPPTGRSSSDGAVNPIIIGQSLGAIPAAHVATERKEVGKLLLISPFTDSDSILKNALPSQFEWLVHLAIFRPKANILDSLRGYTGEIQILVPGEDRLVPTDSQMRIFEKLGFDDASVRVLEGRGHFGLMGEDEFMEQLGAALKALKE